MAQISLPVKPLALAGLVGFAVLAIIGGYWLFEGGSPKPWSGYAWNPNAKRAEFWFYEFETKRDCIEIMRHAVADSKYYSEPIGCAYSGNNYWRVLIMNTLFGGAQIMCIARTTSTGAGASGMVYSPVLQGGRRIGENWYCV